MQQIAVLGRHLQTPGPAHPHHVSTQVGEHHPGMWAGVDAPQLDDLHPRQGPPPATVATQPFFTFSTCLRSSSRPDSTVPFTARLSTNPGSGTTASTASSSFTRVLSPSGVKR